MKTSKSDGLGFCGVLTVVFIVLKLTGLINWSWWYVLMPVYVPILLAILLALLLILWVLVSKYTTK